MTKMIISVFLIVLAASLLDGTDAQFLFSPTTATVSVPENTTAGSAVYKFNVTGAAGSVTYKVMEGTTPSSIFEVTAKEVKIIATASLDYEVAVSHTLTISANDGTTVLTSTLTLTVTVTNVAPSFTNPPVSLSIADASPAGTELYVFVATDPGVTHVAYAIVLSSNTNGDFAIDAASGKVTVATDKTLNATRTPIYNLEITAADTATSPLTAKTTVKVTVSTGSGTAGLSVSVLLMFMCLLLFFQK